MPSLKKALRSPNLFLARAWEALSPVIRDDALFIRVQYLLRFLKPLNLKQPTTFCEKLNWLKLNDHNPLYTRLVDKAEVKDWVAGKVGRQYVIPTYGVWDSPDEIDWERLPQKFILKCTHDSGGFIVCRDKGALDIPRTKRKLARLLRRNFYTVSREWPYKGVRPRIIAEQLMENADRPGAFLNDYKIFVFGGKARLLFVATERDTEAKFDFFDIDFNHLPITNGHRMSSRPIDKPASLGEMVRLAETLGSGLPHVRVDFYEVDGRVYFGEMTFYQNGGFVPFEPREWDEKVGSWIDLSLAGQP